MSIQIQGRTYRVHELPNVGEGKAGRLRPLIHERRGSHFNHSRQPVSAKGTQQSLIGRGGASWFMQSDAVLRPSAGACGQSVAAIVAFPYAAAAAAAGGAAGAVVATVGAMAAPGSWGDPAFRSPLEGVGSVGARLQRRNFSLAHFDGKPGERGPLMRRPEPHLQRKVTAGNAYIAGVADTRPAYL